MGIRKVCNENADVNEILKQKCRVVSGGSASEYRKLPSLDGALSCLYGTGGKCNILLEKRQH